MVNVCVTGAEATWQVCSCRQSERCDNWRHCPAHHCSPVCLHFVCVCI